MPDFKVSSATRLVALFGWPVRHSISPVFQNAAFRAADIDVVYMSFEVPPDSLSEAVTAIKTLGMWGANLTVPHKERVIPFLDELSPTARRVGSVNTIVNDHGRLRGETTDGPGFLCSFQEESGFSVSGKRFLIVGAAGAGRAIAFALAEKNAALYLVNRTDRKTAALVAELQAAFPGNAFYAEPFARRAEILSETRVDVLVNTTSVGLEKRDEPELFPPAKLPDGLLVCDLIYHRKTRLLQSAQQRGLKTINGLGMLIYQGALSFELWTGKRAPVKEMFNSLQGKNRGKRGRSHPGGTRQKGAARKEVPVDDHALLKKTG